jgi:hypothetical protein
MTALLLTLDGVLYQVRADGPGAWRLLALQGKRVGAEYRVTAGGTCTCPDAVFRNHECKHVAACRLVSLLPAVAEVSVERSAQG